MRDSYDLFHLFGWQNLFRTWEWDYVWGDTFTRRINKSLDRLRDKYGWPVERISGKPVTNLIRVLLHTSLKETWHRWGQKEK